MRASGILMHITSLPSPYGIGTLGQAAYDFADFLEKAGQKLWQILPVNPTSYGDSPYQSFSTYAGNPYFIDLDLLRQDGLLEKEDYAGLNWGDDPQQTDYARIYELRFPVLKKAFRAFSAGRSAETAAEYGAFLEENSAWLEDYALYMALKFRHNGAPWTLWEEELRTRKPEAIRAARAQLRQELDFWRFLQFEFDLQWKKLKQYVNEKGIRLIGDAPIYVAMDSADVWANPEMFLLDEELQPTVVAGCPPDYFAKTGQLWGNPIYDWDYLERTGYRWWLQRIAAAVSRCDMVRIDHFRGFESYWAVPAGDETAENGEWRKGPGMKLFERVREELGDGVIIAEDLGMITDPVRELLKETGYPGMKVLQFAFTPGYESDYMPHKHVKNCICYTGTHDNDTLWGWISALEGADLEVLLRYSRSKDREECLQNVIAMAWGSVADTAVATMQDFLGLGSEARMNTPSTPMGNWCWRARPEDFSAELAEKIHDLTVTYWR